MRLGLALTLAASIAAAGLAWAVPPAGLIQLDVLTLNRQKNARVEVPDILPSVNASNGGGTFSDTGADNCNDVTVLPLTLGLPGTPDVFTITGDNTGATGPDCTTLSSVPAWWEAFQIDECADVYITFCGTSPVLAPIFGGLQTACPASGTSCGTRINATSQGFGAPFCSDGNRWLFYRGLQPGTYYYPVRSDSHQGAYQLNIYANVCAGACCDFAVGDCIEGSWAAACSGPDQQFTQGGSCCSLECLPPGETYASSGVELLGHLSGNDFVPGGAGDGSDLWGYVSSSGREYAIIGFDAGTAFAEVTDPFNPAVVAVMPKFSPVWRDIETYLHYAYSVNDFNGGGMEIFDLSQIDNGVVQLAAVMTDSGLSTVHTIAINTETAHAYLCGSNLAGGGFVSVSLADPEDPQIDGFWGVTYVHESLVRSYPDGPYAGREIAFLFGTGQVFYILDVTDKANMFVLGTLPSVPTNFGHQGWITNDRRYLIFGDEGRNAQTTTYVINIEDLANPFLVTAYTTGICSIDHNVMIRGNLAYHANYTSGVHVFDVSDPTNATEVAFLDTHPEGQFHNFQGNWGVYTALPSGIVLLSDIDRGLLIVSYDCNVNHVDDTDDIAAQTSIDCNGNGLPDECEYDPDANGVPENCELRAEPGGSDKNRFISVLMPSPGAFPQQTAIRVRLDSLHHPPGPPDAPDFSAFEGEYRYVNAYVDGGNNPVFDCVDSLTHGTSFKCARLGCQPEYRDWHAAVGGSVLHITGKAVIPSSLYSAALVPVSCLGDEANCPAVSHELGAGTARWGDVLTGDLNVIDISEVVDVIKELPMALGEVNCMIRPHEPQPRTESVNVLDVSDTVDALKEFAYPYPGPEVCP